MVDLESALRNAVRHFWRTRDRQTAMQASHGKRDTGLRSAVTGGAQMDGLILLVNALLVDHGIPPKSIHCRRSGELPGWFRPEKSWDLVVVHDGTLIAALEFKSQVGSFGNNFNNRAEEALGNATDLWTAYREGAFKPGARPWLGFMMLLEDAPASTSPVRVRQPYFPVFPEFQSASYAMRYELMLTKLLRDRLYDGACLILSDRNDGPSGGYREPNLELSFRTCTTSFVARVIAHTELA